MGDVAGLIWTHGLTSSVADELSGGWPFAGVSSLASLLPVTRYDAQGHGQSCVNSGSSCTFEVLGSDIVALSRKWARPRTVIGGTSMGAAASLFACLEDPSAFSGLILATPPSCFEQRRKFLPMYRESIRIAREHGLEEAHRIASSKARPPIFLETEEGRSSFDKGWSTKFAMGVDRYCDALEGAMLSDLPSEDRLRSISIPTLILAWRSDVQHPVETAKMLHAVMPNAELHVADRWSDISEFPSI